MPNVIKASGQIEPFSEEKVRYSIHRAGIPDDIQHEVLSHVKSKLYDNIPTSEIYYHITEFLEGSNRHYIKAKYGLKQAIIDLGPTGYPFEDFVSEILRTEGYETEVRVILEGRCVSHEIDVIAKKAKRKIMIEAKFHNAAGIRTDVHVALYTKARFDDVKDKYGFDEAWVITNTKTTIDALNYGSCTGMKIISWSVPEGESLRDMVEKTKLAPITSLTTLSQAQKQILLENHVVLCRNLVENPNSLNFLALPEEKKKTILSEVEFVLKT